MDAADKEFTHHTSCAHTHARTHTQTQAGAAANAANAAAIPPPPGVELRRAEGCRDGLGAFAALTREYYEWLGVR